MWPLTPLDTTFILFISIVVPFADDLVQNVARTSSGAHISVTTNSVVGAKLAHGHATGYQLFRCFQLYIGGAFGHEVPNETETESNAIISFGVSTRSVPAAAFKYSSFATNQEAVTDIRPALRVHMIVLEASDS